jgi:hypothetical protein
MKNGICPQENWLERNQEPGPPSATITPHGTMSLWLRDGVRVDMTIDRALRIINSKVKTPQLLKSSAIFRTLYNCRKM